MLKVENLPLFKPPICPLISWVEWLLWTESHQSKSNSISFVAENDKDIWHSKPSFLDSLYNSLPPSLPHLACVYQSLLLISPPTLVIKVADMSTMLARFHFKWDTAVWTPVIMKILFFVCRVQGWPQKQNSGNFLFSMHFLCTKRGAFLFFSDNASTFPILASMMLNFEKSVLQTFPTKPPTTVLKANYCQTSIYSFFIGTSAARKSPQCTTSCVWLFCKLNLPQQLPCHADQPSPHCDALIAPVSITTLCLIKDNLIFLWERCTLFTDLNQS